MIRRAHSLRSSVRCSRRWATSPRSSTALDRKSTRLNSSHDQISYAVFCLKKKKKHAERSTLLYDEPRCSGTHAENGVTNGTVDTSPGTGNSVVHRTSDSRALTTHHSVPHT